MYNQSYQPMYNQFLLKTQTKSNFSLKQKIFIFLGLLFFVGAVVASISAIVLHTKVTKDGNQLDTLKKQIQDMNAADQKNWQQRKIDMTNLQFAEFSISTQQTNDVQFQPSIKLLDLSKNQIKSFSNNKISNLQELVLSTNPMNYFDSNDLKSTKIYYDSDWRSTSFSNNIVTFKNISFYQINLQTFSGNQIYNLQSLTFMQNLYNCKRFQFTNNSIHSLTKLNFNKSCIRSMSGNYFFDLQYMSFYNQSIQFLRNNTFPKLKELKIQKSQMKQLDLDSPVLSKLSLNANNLTSFEDYELKSLKELSISQNNLSSFGKNTLPSLETLRIYDNKRNFIFDGAFTNENNMKELTLYSASSFKNNVLNNLTYFQLSISGSFSNNSMQKLKSIKGYYQSDAILSCNEFFDNNLPFLLNLSLTSNLVKFSNNSLNSLQQLRIYRTNILQIDGLNTFQNLQYLYLQQNNVSRLQNISLPKLRYLNITSNNLIGLISLNFPNLTDIQISENKYIKNVISCNFPLIESFEIYDYSKLVYFSNNIMDSIKNLYNLQTISIEIFSNNSFELVEKFNFTRTGILNFSDNRLPRVRQLYLPGNTLIQFKNNHLPNLTKLVLAGRVELNSIIQSLTNQSIIQEMSLFNVKVSDFQQVSRLKKLKYLLLNITQTIQVCNFYENWENLVIKVNKSDGFENNTFPFMTQLIFDSSQLSKFQNNSLPQLKLLNLSKNLITNFSNFNLPELQELNMEQNNLSTFRNNNFSKLSKLNLDKVKGLTMDQILLNRFGTLEVLTLRQSDISVVKSASIDSLKELILGYSKIQTFQDNIFEKVQVLSLWNSKLSSFRNNSLGSINFISFYNCNLSSIEGNNMKTVETIDLQKNKFTDNIGDQIVQLNLTNLKKVDLRNNLITSQTLVRQKIYSVSPTAQILF